MRRRDMLAGATVALAFVVPVAPATAADHTIKIAYETSETHLKARTAAKFAEELASLSGGRIAVEIHPNASLLPSKQEVNAAIRGQVQVILPFVSYYESVAPAVKIFTMPMIFRSYDHLEAAFAGPVGDTIRGQLADKGLKALGFWYETPTHLFTTEKSVTSLAALNGMKIRTYPSALLEQTLNSLGAVPTVIPGSEVYLALKNGVAEGALTTPSFAHSIKLTDSLRHMTRINLAFGGYIMAINAKFFDALPADLQEAVGEAAARATAWNREAIVAEVEKSEQLMRDAGVAIHDLDDGDRPNWVNAIQPVIQNQDQSLQDLAAQAG